MKTKSAALKALASTKAKVSKAIKIETAPFDAADYLDDNETIAAYLTAALTDPDPDVFLVAVKDVARARGMSQLAKDTQLGTLCITLARLWQADRDEVQGVFLQPIARLLARKTTQQIARFRLITDRRELCRGSLACASSICRCAATGAGVPTLRGICRTPLRLGADHLGHGQTAFSKFREQIGRYLIHSCSRA